MQAVSIACCALQDSKLILNQLDLNTGFGVVSHAHPPPACASPQALEEQRVRALITRQSINVVLRGLSCGRAATVADILTPKIRRSPLNEKSMLVVPITCLPNFRTRQSD